MVPGAAGKTSPRRALIPILRGDILLFHGRKSNSRSGRGLRAGSMRILESTANGRRRWDRSLLRWGPRSHRPEQDDSC